MTRKLEREALDILRQLGKRQGFSMVFAHVLDRARESTGPEARCWEDLEDLLAIDLGERR